MTSPTNLMQEICADSRVIPAGHGSFLRLGPKSGADIEAQVELARALPKMPGVTNFAIEYGTAKPLTHTDAKTVRTLITRYLGRNGPEALDRMVENPLGDHGLGLADLFARADLLGLPVQVPLATLRPATDTAVDLEVNRIVPLNRDGTIGTMDTAQYVRVLPLLHRGQMSDTHNPEGLKPYQNVDPRVGDVLTRKSYLPSRLVFGPDGVELGLPAGLVEHLHGGFMRDTARELDPRDWENAIQASPPKSAANHVDLLRELQGAPGSQSMVQVTNRADNTTTYHWADHTNGNHSLLDLLNQTALALPHTGFDVAVSHQPGTMTLTERQLDFDAMREDLTATEPVPLPLGVRGARTFGPDGKQSVAVIDAKTPESDKFVDQVSKAIEGLGISALVVGADRPYAPLARDHDYEQITPEQQRALDKMIINHDLFGTQLPVLVTQGSVTPEIEQILDKHNLSIIHRTPGAAAAQRAAEGAGGTMGSLNLENEWVVRGPKNATVARPSSKLSPDLFKAAAAQKRPPTVTRASKPVASFLSTSLSDKAGITAVLAENASALKTLRPELDKLAAENKILAAHGAFMTITEIDPAIAEQALDHLSDTAARHETALSMVPAIAAKTPEVRATLFANLRTIADAEVDDGATRGILAAVEKVVNGADPETVKQDIFTHSKYLPQGGRPTWIRKLTELSQQMPQLKAGLERVAYFVTVCP